jgi:glutamyl-Q tRNA(Asp) synthetase
MSDFITRFAPSPTGLLHEGHAYSALCAYETARQANGRFILRLEDIDTLRCRPEFEQSIFDDLHWLGLRWEEPVRRQSAHSEEYTRTLNHLCKMGVMYRCFLTRREVMAEMMRAPHGTGKVYTGPAKPMDPNEEAERLERGETFAWRLSLQAARQHLGKAWDQLGFIEQGSSPEGENGTIKASPERLGDVILARKDIATSYHLAVTHDDACQGITHVIRGQDLFESTHIHVLLQALLGLPTPIYCHHPLIRDTHGQRLAKRDRAATLQALRQSGMRASDLRQTLMSNAPVYPH